MGTMNKAKITNKTKMPVYFLTYCSFFGAAA